MERPQSQGQLRTALLPLDLSTASRHLKTSKGRPSSASRRAKEVLQANVRLRKDLGSASDSRLATATRLQNTLKKKYEERLQTSLGCDHEGSGSEEWEEADLQSEEVFADGVAKLAHSIEDLAKHIRFDHLHKSDAKLAKLEAAPREKEVEMRRARKKEQMARDPRRKVKLKLEKGRRERDELDLAKVGPDDRRLSKDVPLYPFHSEDHGPCNQDPVRIVDVKKIQRSCQSLGHHHTALELLELRKRHDQPRRVGQKHGNKAEDWLHGLLDGFTLEDRLARVKAQRDTLTAEKMRRRLQSMRTQCPAYLLRAWGSLGLGIEPLELDSDSDIEEASRRGSVSSNRSEAMSSPTDSRKSTRQRATIADIRRGTNTLSPASTYGLGKAFRRSYARPSSARIVEMERQKLEQKRKLRRCRLAIRGCVQWLKILFKRRRRFAAADVCLVLLKQIGEWVRMRGALKQFVNNVKTIQRTVRDYLAMKRRRCYLIEKEWCRIEDMHLSTHAQHRAQNAMQDLEDKPKGTSMSKLKKRRILQAALEASMSKLKHVVDYNAWRIPVAERRAIIAAYHKRAMKHHMQIGKTFLQLVFDALRAGRELDNFLCQFHYDGGRNRAVESLQIKKDDLITDIRQEKEDVSYWQMNEAMIVKLVALCAQGLAGADAFKEHPANQAVPPEKRNVWSEYVVGSDPYEFAEFIMMQIDRPVYRGRFGRHPGLRAEDILFEEQRKIEGAREARVPSRFLSPGSKIQQVEEEVQVVEVSDVDQALTSFRPRLTLQRSKEFRRLDSTTFSSTASLEGDMSLTTGTDLERMAFAP